MPDPQSATDGSDWLEVADGGCFASLASARYMRLTMFKRDGIPVSATVHGLVDGDRVYFRAGSRSATAKCLQYTDAVRVTPCSALGWTYGPPIDATVRQLPCDEARRAAAELGRKYPVRHRVLIRLPRRQAVYYELVADNGAGEQDEVPEGLPAPLIIRVEASPVMCADAATPTSLAPVCTPSLTARSCPSGDTWIITVSMSLAARMPAAETRADQAAASTSASSHIP